MSSRGGAPRWRGNFRGSGRPYPGSRGIPGGRGVPGGRGAPPRGNQHQPPSVFQSWAHKRAKQEALARGDPIVIDDSQEPSPSTSATSNPPVFSPGMAPLETSPRYQRERDREAIMLDEAFTSADLLNTLGFDSAAGKDIHFPISEFVRPYEEDLINICVRHNCAIGLHMDTSPAHIAAVLFFNFLRWFPRGRCVFSCLTVEHLESIKERLAAIGISDSEITVVDSMTAFKKAKDHQIGRVMLTSPQNLQKIVESENTRLIDDIRCIFIQFENSRETGAKYKKVLTALSLRNVVTRVVVHIPKLSYTTVKTSSITNRQSIITNLGLAEWKEVGLNDERFRAHGISTMLAPVFWKEDELGDTVNAWRARWRKGCLMLLDKLITAGVKVPSSDPEELFYATWSDIVKEASPISTDVLQLCTDSLFCCQAYRHLTLHGPRAYYLFCHATLTDRSASSRSLELHSLFAEYEDLIDVYHGVQDKYEYAADDVYDVTFKQATLESHPKYKKLRELVESYCGQGKVNRLLILCESAICSRVATECLTDIPETKVIHAVINDKMIKDEGLRRFHKSSNALYNAFNQGTSTVVVLRVDLPLAYQTIDSITSNGVTCLLSMDRRSLCLVPLHQADYTGFLSEKYETLRPGDGRQTLDEFPTLDRQRTRDAIGVVDRYDFDFQPSRLCLGVAAMRRREFFRAAVAGRSQLNFEDSNQSAGRFGFELNAAEDAEYRRRAAGHALPQFESIHFRVDEITDDQLFWNDHCHGQYGQIGSSLLTQKFLSLGKENEGNNLVEEQKYDKFGRQEVELVSSQLDRALESLNELFNPEDLAWQMERLVTL